MNVEHPKVFISHASEDKDKFVIAFATKLRNHGIAAWVDWWEILPGNSIIDKIFEEGLKEAIAVIVVLSKVSVQKPWVKEELNTAVVKKISQHTKLIPVVIDDWDIPEALHSTVWQKISNLDSYENELDQIVKAIYGQYNRPPLGPTPTYAQIEVTALPGLTPTDTLALKLLCERSMETGSAFLNTNAIDESITKSSMSEPEFLDSLEILNEGYLIELTLHYGNARSLKITDFGFESYAEVYLPGFEKLRDDVLIASINLDLKTNEQIATHFDSSLILIDYILDILASKNLIRVARYMGGSATITDVTVQGRRAASNL
ncbi:MAG: toll/interleukin-1 receptor domain-containing protein [Dehalococcoidia bacterium]